MHHASFSNQKHSNEIGETFRMTKKAKSLADFESNEIALLHISSAKSIIQVLPRLISSNIPFHQMMR